MRFAADGKATVLFGGQWGSEGKGAIAAWLALQTPFTIATTNAGAQAGHTSIHLGEKFVAFHLPTVAVYQKDCLAYVNAGSIIDVDVLLDEVKKADIGDRLRIHPRAAIITPECQEAERAADASTTRIASTQKGVGEAFARKIRRSGKVAADEPRLARWIEEIDLNSQMDAGARVVVEVPQGFSLSLNASPFYPYTTSRDCGVAQGLSDAGIHPKFLDQSIMVIRTLPIRVGNIVGENGETLGTSGGHFDDHAETSFEALGVPAERTTVTKRIRRIFGFSLDQVEHSIKANRPEIIALTFVNYLNNRAEVERLVDAIEAIYHKLRLAPPRWIFEWGPTTREASPHLPYSEEIWRK